MQKILLSTTNEEERRLAVIFNGKLTDYLSVVSGQEDRRGSIFCGIVSEVEPSLDACFVDIGDNKKGFLQFSDIHPDCLLDKKGPQSERLAKGQPILVQVTKDSRSEKGPLLTTRIKMQSHHLLLMAREKEPEGLRISRKASDSEKDRIQEASDRLGIEEGMSLIVRSNGLDKTVDSLAWEKDSLITLWQLILKVFAKQEQPALIYEHRNIVNICLSEYLTNNTDEIVCDSETTALEIKDLLDTMGNSMSDKVRCVEDDETLFNDSVLKQIDALVSHKVSLPSGGEIVIDITEALVAIDVNSSRSRGNKGIEDTAFNTNTEAATEIARQLKLRNLSGLVVIDFIDLVSNTKRKQLENLFQRSLRGDRAQISTAGISTFGMLEMTRQYIGRSMHESHSTRCTQCGGIGRIPNVRAFAVSILDKVQDLCINRNQVATIYVELTVDAATYILNDKRTELNRIQEDFGVEVIILPSVYMLGGDSNFRVDKDARVAAKTKPSYKYRTSDKLEKDFYIKKMKSNRKLTDPEIPTSVHLRQQPPKDDSNDQALPDDATKFSEMSFTSGNDFRSSISSENSDETAPESEDPRRNLRSDDRKRPRKSASLYGDRKDGSRRRSRGRSQSRNKPPYDRKSDDGDQQSPASEAHQYKSSDAPARNRRRRPQRRKSPLETRAQEVDPAIYSDGNSDTENVSVHPPETTDGNLESSQEKSSQPAESPPTTDSWVSSENKGKPEETAQDSSQPAPEGTAGPRDAKPTDDHEPVTESTAADASVTKIRRRNRGNTVRKPSSPNR